MTQITKDDFTEWKKFHIGNILTIVTGIMVTSEGIGGVYEILDWMTDDQLFTHQLPRASRECEPTLKALYPELAEVVPPDSSHLPDDRLEVFWLDWLNKQIAIFGEELPVPKLTNHEAVNPISELQGMLEKNNSSAKIVLLDPESLDSESKHILERLADGS